MSNAANPYPVRVAGETGLEFHGRMQEYQGLVNDAHLENKTFGGHKTCGECGVESGAAKKTCACGANLSLSQTASAIKSRETRERKRLKHEAKYHDICGICLNALAKGNIDLAISMCTVFTRRRRSNGSMSVSSKLVPCGRAMHLKCMQKRLKNSLVRHGVHGLSANTCANCNLETQEPHYVEIYVPRK